MNAKVAVLRPRVELDELDEAAPREVPLASIFGHDPLTMDSSFPGSTQIRATTDAALVERYAALMADGVVFPPVSLVETEGGSYLLADGHHRYEARAICHAMDAKRFPATIMATVVPGTMADAVRLAIEANRAHGQALNAADLTHAYRRAVGLNLIPAIDTKATHALLGCTERHARRLTAFARKNYIEDRNALIIALDANGETQEEIAETVSLTRQAVGLILQECKKRTLSDTCDDEEPESPPEQPDPEAEAKAKAAAADNWRRRLQAKRAADAAALAAVRKAEAEGAIDEIEGIYPLPDAPELPFKRPTRAHPEDLDVVSEILEQIDRMPEVAALLPYHSDHTQVAEIQRRIARSRDWLTEFTQHWTDNGETG